MTVQTIDISGNRINLEGFFQIGELIDSPFPYKCFKMNNLEFGDKGSVVISSYLFKSNAPMTHLYINGNQLSNQGITHIIDAIKSKRGLKVFHASYNKLDSAVAEKVVELLMTNNSITELALADCALKDEGFKILFKGLMSLPKLEYLDLRNCGLTSSSMKLIEKLLKQHIQCLTHFAMARNPIGDKLGEILIKILSKKGNTLAHVNVGYCKLSSGIVSDLFKSVSNGIQTLIASGNPLKKKAISYLVESLNDQKNASQQTIKTIRLRQCGLGKSSIALILNAAKKHSTLQVLDLGENWDNNTDRLVDCGPVLQEFCSVNKNVQDLDLGLIGLNQSDVSHLVKGLSSNTSLAELHLKGAKIGDNLSKIAEAVLNAENKIQFLDLTNAEFSLDNFESFLAELCEFLQRQEKPEFVKKLIVLVDAQRFTDANAVPRIASKIQKLQPFFLIKQSD